MAGKKTSNTQIEFANTPAEQLRRVWLAGLGAFSLTRKHGGQWFGRFVEEGQDFTARSAQFAREAVADAQAQATGIFSPILLRAEKQFDAYAKVVEKGVGRVLHRFGIPSKREVEDLSRHVATLTRKLKTAK
ncbi:MAG: phasin family protein [Proteobacteria bacterium]|uniref:phasin family protein n=1 Tax=Rudaea sp. TaxID=2136325 RepID=UPI003220824B|nr:phasin family protein [Pseudomonadota bacterium]